jgi:PST family polysaccharide transporter
LLIGVNQNTDDNKGQALPGLYCISKGAMEHLKSKAINGATWNISLALANKGATTLGQFALAWFLVPKDMGVANIAISVVAVVTVLSIGGIGDVLLQRGRYLEEASQGFWLSLIFTIFTIIILAVLSILHPIFKGENLKNFFLLMALAAFAATPNTVLAVDLKRKMHFKQLAISRLSCGSAYTGAMVGLAWLGLGPYAIVAPLVLRQMVDSAVMLTCGARFRFAPPNIPVIREIFSPSIALSISGLLSALQTQAPVLICGYALGAESTGFFSWGWALASQAVFLLAGNLREVFFSAFANLPSEKGRREEAMLKAAWMMTALLFVACGTQAFWARPLIVVFLPAKWLPAISVVIVASLGLLLQGMWVAGTAYLNANGRYRALLVISIVQAALVTGFTGVGAIRGGATGAAIGCALATLLGGIICIWPIKRYINLSQINKWVNPASVSAIVWALLWIVTLKFQFIWVQLLAGFLFLGISGFSWWKQDPGELATVWRGITGKLISKKNFK